MKEIKQKITGKGKKTYKKKIEIPKKTVKKQRNRMRKLIETKKANNSNEPAPTTSDRT